MSLEPDRQLFSDEHSNFEAHERDPGFDDETTLEDVRLYVRRQNLLLSDFPCADDASDVSDGHESLEYRQLIMTMTRMTWTGKFWSTVRRTPQILLHPQIW